MEDVFHIPTTEEIIDEFNIIQGLRSRRLIETSRMKLAAERGRLTLDAINFQIDQLKHWRIDENDMPRCIHFELLPLIDGSTVEEQMEMEHYEEQLEWDH